MKNGFGDWPLYPTQADFKLLKVTIGDDKDVVGKLMSICLLA